MTVGIIRVFSTEDEDILNAHGNRIQKLYNIDCVNKSISNQSKGIYNSYTENLAIPKIIELAKELELDNVSAIAISCAADPGLNEVRSALSIPVVGAGSSAANLAKTISSKIGVLTIANEVPKVIEEILGDALISWKKPDGINNTADLLRDGAIEKSLEASKLLIDEGADTILFACTGYVTIGFEKIVREQLDVTVIDPVAAEGNALSFILRGA